MKERTKRESDNRRREEKWQTCWCCRDHQRACSGKLAEWRRLQRKNLSILDLPKRKEWPQCHRESSWQERRSRPYQEEKEHSRQSKAPDHEGGRESRWARAAPWRESFVRRNCNVALCVYPCNERYHTLKFDYAFVIILFYVCTVHSFKIIYSFVKIQNKIFTIFPF